MNFDIFVCLFLKVMLVVHDKVYHRATTTHVYNHTKCTMGCELDSSVCGIHEEWDSVSCRCRCAVVKEPTCGVGQVRGIYFSAVKKNSNFIIKPVG